MTRIKYRCNKIYLQVTLGKCHTAIFLKLGIQVVHGKLLDTYIVISARKPFEG